MLMPIGLAHRSDRDNPSWRTPLGMTALGFISASLGLQVRLYLAKEELEAKHLM